MIQIAVVDDEKSIREQIKNLAEKKRMVNLVDTYFSGEEFLKVKKDYDIIFLDIQMEGMNGIDVAKEIRKQNIRSVLIFITGMKEYVFEAFDVSAFHYLLSPLKKRNSERCWRGRFLRWKRSGVWEADNFLSKQGPEILP